MALLVIKALFRIVAEKVPTMKSLDSDKKAGKSGAVEEATANDNNGFFKDNAKIDFSNVKIEPLFEQEVDFDTFSKSDFRAVKVKLRTHYPTQGRRK